MPILTFTWWSVLDARSCDKCDHLDGYTWYFYDELPTQLLHPHFGLVWDVVVDESRAHGYPSRRGRFNCRCYVTWTINDQSLQDELIKLREDVELIENQVVATLQLMEQFTALLLRAT